MGSRCSHGGKAQRFSSFQSGEFAEKEVAVHRIHSLHKVNIIFLLCISLLIPDRAYAQHGSIHTVSAKTVQGKVMCGYQGWFRCPGDPTDLGWVHWSRDSKLLSSETACFEMWPDMSEYSLSERHAAPGFTYPDGRQADLYTADNARTVLRHFEWMRNYGVDGAWLQHFLVDLPGGPLEKRYPSRLRVLNHVRKAARKTGRVWAISYDIAALPTDRIYDVLTTNWKRMVDDGVIHDLRYLHEGNRPVVQIWGFYYHNESNLMTAELANRLINFFKTPGRYAAYLVGGGDWNWRQNPDPEWRKFYRRFDMITPWNVGNFSTDVMGQRHASMSFWNDDIQECKAAGVQWVPVIYPGFSWDNLMRKPPGTTTIPRRGGRFLWEQFHELARLHIDSVYVAMFDEVDEGTAIFKVTSSPPTQAHFVSYDGLPSDWYLRLVGEGARILRGDHPDSVEIPLKP